MAVLMLASIGAGIWLALTGRADLVALGLMLFAAAFAIAWIMEYLIARLEDLALAAQTQWGPVTGALLALLCGLVPTLVVMLWVYGVFHWFGPDDSAIGSLAGWLFSYGVATAPWTVFALRADGDRRTLTGVRAYAVHLAYWLLSLSLFFLPDTPGLAGAAMLLPAILPLTMGTVIARADRAMLQTVRI